MTKTEPSISSYQAEIEEGRFNGITNIRDQNQEKTESYSGSGEKGIRFLIDILLKILT